MPNRKKLTRKKNKQRGGKRVNKKKTESKKRTKISNQLKPENIGKILSNIHILLSFPSVEFLPSTNIFLKNNTGHYLQMIDYQDLANIINQNPKYKKSPTIQNIFNYKSYRLENENEIIFNYKNIQCDNLLLKEQKNYNVKLLFLYLLECNIEERLKKIIQTGGDDEYDFERMIDYDINQKKDEFKEYEAREKEEEQKKEFEKIRILEKEKFMERKRLEDEMREQQQKKEQERDIEQKKEFEQELNEQTKKVLGEEKEEEKEKTIQEEINEEKKVLNEMEEYKEDLEEEKEEKIERGERLIDEEIKRKEMFEQKMNEEERKMKENVQLEKMEMEKKLKIKIQGFEEFLENKKVSNISKNSFAVYNVNWFNVCCGIEKYDDQFEENIQQQISDMGLIINEREIVENLVKLFEDREELSKFQKMIKNRLITCSEIEPPSFFEKLFTDSFGTFKKCDERSPQSLLYLYDGYNQFLEREVGLSKLDKVLLLIYCETRQHTLSKYISLEIIRKENEKKKKEKITSILNKIMDSDKSIIKKNEELYKEQRKLQYSAFKEKKMKELKEQNRVKALVNENNIIIQKNKIKNLEDEEFFDEPRRVEKEPGFFDKLKDLFETNAESPTFELKLTPKEREAYQKAMKKMKGGGPISYESTEKEKNEVCNKIKNEKNIYKYQLNMVDYC
tara:strand:- start:8604 stop:10634 length:2031 start_codon:yes stop_codon:yes gene_type:complete